MAEYFDTRDEAEQFIKEWYAKDRKPPVHFAKIFNHGAEKWIVNYDPRQNPAASPAIKVLENHSGEIRQIVSSAVAPRPQAATPPPQPVVAGGGYHSGKVGAEIPQSLTLHSKYKVLVGDSATELAIKENAFRAGEGIAAFVTFLDSAPDLNVNGDFLQLIGKLKCACGKEFSFEQNFYGARGGGEIRCSCGRGFGAGFHYPMSGYKSGGFFLYLCPNRPGQVSVAIEDVALVDAAKRQEREAEAKRVADERRRREEEAKQRELQQQREREERRKQDDLRAKQEQERIAALRRQRQAEGKCLVCGKRLGVFAKLFGRLQHSNCAESITGTGSRV